MKELEKVYACLDAQLITPEEKTNGVVEAIKHYLLTNPLGIQLVQNIYSGIDVGFGINNFHNWCQQLQQSIKNDELLKQKFGEGMSAISDEDLAIRVAQMEATLTPVRIMASDVQEVETASVKQDDYDWFTFSGCRKKKFKYANAEYIVSPGSLVGISKTPDLQGKHLCCIVNDGRDKAIQLKSKDVNLFKKRCTPFTGETNAIFNPNPTGNPVAVG